MAVPRVYEKIHTQAELKAKGLPNSTIFPLGAFRRRLPPGMRSSPAKLQLRAAGSSANRLVYQKIRAGMGGRVQVFISGGTPLGRRARRMVCHRSEFAFTRARPDRNLARHRRQHSGPPQAGHRRQAAGQRRSQNRRRRGDPCPRSFRLPELTGSGPRKVRTLSSIAGSRPATSATSTPTAFSPSPTGRRT